jgi:hypothetical protein
MDWRATYGWKLLRAARGAPIQKGNPIMTGNLDLYNAFVKEAWANPPVSNAAAAQKYLADDFKLLDPDGTPTMDKRGFVAMGQMLFQAFTGFKYVVTDTREAEGGVLVTGHFEGTHTGDLDLSALGAGVVPASGEKIVWPDATNKWTIVDGKMVSSQPVKGGGIEAFLAPLGVTQTAN